MSRTTVRLDPDVAAAAEHLRRERHIGLSEAVNVLARAGMERTPIKRAVAYRQRVADLRLTVDVSNIADALDLIDDQDSA